MGAGNPYQRTRTLAKPLQTARNPSDFLQIAALSFLRASLSVMEAHGTAPYPAEAWKNTGKRGRRGGKVRQQELSREKSPRVREKRWPRCGGPLVRRNGLWYERCNARGDRTAHLGISDQRAVRGETAPRKINRLRSRVGKEDPNTMARTPGHHDGLLHDRLRLRLAERPIELPPRPPAEDGDLVDAMTIIAAYLATAVRLSKIACLLLALVALGVALRVVGV